MCNDSGINNCNVYGKIHDLIPNNNDKSQVKECVVLDLSTTQIAESSKPLSDFLFRPSTPKRESKKLTVKNTYAITSAKWKAEETKKFELQKTALQRKEAKKLEIKQRKKRCE